MSLFNLHDNDKKLIRFAKEKTMEVMRAAGATEVVQEARYAHLVGARAWVLIRKHRLLIASDGRMILTICLSAMEYYADARIG